MKAVSQGYMDAWKSKQGKVSVLLVKYSRRFWDEGSSTFKYETNADGSQRWVQLTSRDIVQVGQITWKLDTPLLNTVRASNVTLRLKNEDYQWVEQNQTSGVFRPDAFSMSKQPAMPARGYDPMLTQVQILLGYVEANGAIEPLPIFTGVAIDYCHDTDRAYTEMAVSGNEFLLQSADAQKVSLTFTGEQTQKLSAGVWVNSTGDGVTTKFFTASTGVSQINSETGITVDGVNQKQGRDYTLSGLNTYTGRVTITFTVAQANTAVILVSGRKWYTLQPIDSLVGLLCTQAGITDVAISPVTFPNLTLSQLFINTATQWQACTLTGLTATVVPGSIQASGGYTNQNFETGDLTGWTSTAVSGGGASVQNRHTYQGGYAAFISASASLANSFSRSAYLRNVSTGAQVSLIDLYNGVTTGVWSQYSMAIPNDGNSYQIVFECIVQGSVGRITSNLEVYGGSGTVTFYAMAVNPLGFNVSLQLYVDQIAVNAGTPYQATALSAEIDLGAAPAQWSQMDVVSADLNGGSVSWSTQGATASGGSYSGLTAATGNIPQSPLDRYLKIQTELNGIIDGGGNVWNLPSVSSIRLQFYASAIVLAMADFSSSTCWDAIQQLAQLCDYEWGFTATGTFFFRPKSVSATPVISFDQSDVIQSVSNFRPGYDAVINDGQVTYGDYFNEYDSDTLPETGPKSQQRFLTQQKTESWSLLLAFDADIAAGRAQLLHDNNYRPKRTCKITGKIIPFIDLSDVVSFSFFNHRAAAMAWFGDPIAPKWASEEAAFGQPQNVLARSLVVKMIGITFDPQNGKGEYDVQEVLS